MSFFASPHHGGVSEQQQQQYHRRHNHFDDPITSTPVAVTMDSDSPPHANSKHFNAYTGASTPPRTPPREKQRRNAAAVDPPVANGRGRSSSTTTSLSSSPAAANNSNNNNSSYSNSGNSSVVNEHHAQLAAKLSQYTRGADRRQVLRSLMDPRLMPRIHPLKSVWVEDIAAAEREAAGERAALNGVKFLQIRSPRSVNKGGETPSDENEPVDSYFLQTLREICGHMCDMDGVDADPMALYGGLLLRLSRSVSERDALETVTRWSCGKGELVVLPVKKRHHEPSARPPAPIDVELYVEGGNVHAKVSMGHEFGLYRRTDLESTHGLKRELSPWNALILAGGRGDENMAASTSRKMGQIQYEALASPKFANPLKPWAFIDADVVERINFGTGSSVRVLHVRVPEDKNSGYVKKW